uniref:Des-Arg9-bradykinin n=1 Tax=Phasmahyla jandaia TaxID=762504 RepID=BRK2_PHAJA|nr:RecName: Full=Des-Arg9-bradykinin; Short=Des-Arg-bradykinin [Phasmahyla jandaia]prf//1103176C bradykinin,des-9-Arg [Pelophylax nigromaculatus]
RPPGFSPF